MADAGGGHHHQVKSIVLFRRNRTHLRISFDLQHHRKLYATAAVRVPRGLRRRPAEAPASPGVAWRRTHLDDLSQAGVTGHTVECRLGEGKEASSLRHQRLVSYFRCSVFWGEEVAIKTPASFSLSLTSSSLQRSHCIVHCARDTEKIEESSIKRRIR